MSGQTKILADEKTASKAVPQIKPVDMGMPRPWRIALTVMDMQIQLILDLTQAMSIGRANPESDVFPDIDLTPFNAEEAGVSRQHGTLKLHEDRVVIVDNGSSNGTFLNGERLEAKQAYPLRNGDELELGMMKLKVELLMNPFEMYD